VLVSGGLPLDFPVTSLGEEFLNPTSMVFRDVYMPRLPALMHPGQGRGKAARVQNLAFTLMPKLRRSPSVAAKSLSL